MNNKIAFKITCLACLMSVLAVILSMAGCDAIDQEYEYELRKQIEWAEDACNRGAADACKRESYLYDELYEVQHGGE